MTAFMYPHHGGVWFRRRDADAYWGWPRHALGEEERDGVILTSVACQERSAHVSGFIEPVRYPGADSAMLEMGKEKV